MNEEFDHALDVVLRHEGGYSDHPKDPGGKTRFGITLKTFRRLFPSGNFSKLDKKLAGEIYRNDYWDRCRCDDLPPGIDLAVFDCAVNQGPPVARKLLQKAAKVKVDGFIGPITVRTINSKPGVVLTDFMARRATRYGLLSIFKFFGLGWMRRIFDVHQESIEMRRMP